MPSGRPPVSPANIAFIEKWIDDGCPEDPLVDPAAPLAWRRTNAPVASSRTDDIWFIDPLTGWAVNSDGAIVKTSDGGRDWVTQHTAPGVYLRCVGFANPDRGWVGTLTPAQRLLQTTDGGANWAKVTGLPALAPVAVCGLSVVSASVVYASGTNRPTDVPRMMKTADGGATWTAWDMSAHANVLIDTFFTDPLHGWVVGGKAAEPTPTTRDKLKPVVLETSDGGVTWVNRLAGQEAQFPFGEWGWKIQFLDSQHGFVSLENFSAGAILKTADGGQSWSRHGINDPQGNANLEGIGFVDTRHGWVGGWGTADFTGGFSSETTDGGATWKDANQIGLFINRFRFFGNPVHTGYASGDSVYKYSSEPVQPVTSIAAGLGRVLLPDARIEGTVEEVPIRLKVAAGTQRLTVQVWTRFGEEVGSVLDEIRPVAGPRVFGWDGRDRAGQRIAPGDYIVRAIADATSESAIAQVRPAGRSARAVAAAVAPARPRGRRTPMPRLGMSMAALVREPRHDLAWVKDALQLAIQLELATLPPYLTARWTIESPQDPAARNIYVVRGEEMLHFGLACNLLVAIGGTPVIADPAVVPKYPGPLPGNIRPGLVVTLRKLSADQARVFMEIEYPRGGPVAEAAIAGTPVTIGEFYESIATAFDDLQPTISTDRQIEGPPGLWKITSLAGVREAIALINRQGEGSNASPEEAPGDLAHYYRFGEIANGRKFVKDAAGVWGFSGPPIPMPAVYDMADVPEGGYLPADVPDLAVRDLIERFDRHYSEMLRLLETAWTNGDPAVLLDAVGAMGAMAAAGRELVKRPRPDGQGNYGPCFRYVE
jgi:photosystem II stability/assembly factor-like uncharacterized protein